MPGLDSEALDILGTVIGTEIGDVGRFGRHEQLAAYAGTVPRVHESGGRRHYGPVRSDVNRYLKWAFVEAANGVCRNRRLHRERHTSRLYERIARRRGHQKAIGAVARHLAEATYWMLTKGEPYREPRPVQGGVSADSVLSPVSSAVRLRHAPRTTSCPC